MTTAAVMPREDAREAQIDEDCNYDTTRMSVHVHVLPCPVHDAESKAGLPRWRRDLSKGRAVSVRFRRPWPAATLSSSVAAP